MNTQQVKFPVPLKTDKVVSVLKELRMTIPTEAVPYLKPDNDIKYTDLVTVLKMVSSANDQKLEILYDVFFYIYNKMNNNTIIQSGTTSIDDSTLLGTNENYEHVNHPSHYNNYSKEVIDMMESIWGIQNLITFCEMNAFKYRMRMGTKPENSIEQDIQKEQWYLNKAKELKDKLIKTKKDEFFNEQ